MLPGGRTVGNGTCPDNQFSTGEIMGDDGTNYDYTVFAPTANAVAESMPEEVEYASCVLPEREYNIYYEEKLLSDVDYIYVDSCFFQVFGIPLLKGNLKDLIIPGSVFVSERFARETFADEDPVGKILSADKQNTLRFAVYTKMYRKIRADPRFCGIYL